MKKLIQKLTLLCLTLTVLSGSAWAQTNLDLNNPGFEFPASGKIKTGFDTTGNDIPGWMNAGTVYNDSGIENSGAGYSGSWAGYCQSTEGGAYQIVTNYTMAFGDLLTLTWWTKDSYNGSIQKVTLIRASADNSTYASTTELAVQSSAVPGDWTQYTLNYTAGSADMGKYIGIYFNNVKSSAGSWENFDDFALTVTNVPAAPYIITQPSGQSVYEGGAAAFTASAGGPDLSYQWKGGAVGSGIYTNIPGATTANLSIPYAMGDADYVMVASNPSGSATTTPATLSVTPATWVNGLFNGDFELPGTGKINSGFDVSGANNVPGWRNAGPAQSDSGIESLGAGRNNSWAAYLQGAQNGAYQISSNRMSLNDVITLSWWARDSWQGMTARVALLSATSRDATLGSTTVLGARTNNLTGTWWTQYTITYIAGAGDVGKYLGVSFESIDASAGKWSDFDDFSIIISPAPVILGQPASSTAYLTGTATFTVLATGSQPLSYQWQAGAVGSGIYTNISNGGQFAGATTASLTISNVVVDNALDYIVTVTNLYGIATSTAATLTVDTNAPLITTQPASLTRLTGETATLWVVTTGGVSYQWQAGVVGGGVYTNVGNSGNISGANAATLTITNVQKGNQADYIVIVSNGSGSVTSTPAATFTVLNKIYSEYFDGFVGQTSLVNVGWRADARNEGNNRLFDNNGGGSVWSWNDAAGNPAEAFYTTTTLANGSIPGHMAFPGFSVALSSNIVFHLDNQSWWQPALTHTRFAVQMNWGPWYVNTTELTQPAGNWTTYSLPVDFLAANWSELTVSGTGSTTTATIGNVATSDLKGVVTGTGLVIVHDGSSTANFDNFKISGDGTLGLPDLKAAMSGSSLGLTWNYGTLLEAPSLMGPWTTNTATSPYLISPSSPQKYFRILLP